MLRSLRQLYGKKLGACDGDIGHVKDFYFNDQQWDIRYGVREAGSCLAGRLVLIPPRAFGNLPQGADCLPVNLTRQQIENSPAVESHKPVSLQYQAYWDGCEPCGVAHKKASLATISSILGRLRNVGRGRFPRGSSSATSYAE